MQPAKLLILAFMPALVSGRRMSSSDLVVNHDEKLASDIKKNSVEASYTEMAPDASEDSNKASDTEMASDSKSNCNNASYPEMASDSEKDPTKASFIQEDSNLATHTEETSLESEELLNEGMLKDFKTDFKNTYDPHFQTYVCDCGKKSVSEALFSEVVEWRSHSNFFATGLWTGNKPSKLSQGLHS